MCTPCSSYLHSSIAHLNRPPSHFSPAGPQPWSSSLPWPSAGIPADASAPLTADNPSSLTLLQLSSPPHWQSRPTDVSLLICRLEQQEQPPSCDAHCFCMHVWAHPLLLFSPDALTSLSPLYLPGASAVSSLLSAYLKAKLSSRLGSCLGNRQCSAGIPGRQEGQMMALW